MADQDEIKNPFDPMIQMKLNDFVRNRTLTIYGEINEDTEYVINRQLDRLVYIDGLKGSKMPITFKISSPGGDAFSAFSIVSKMQELKEKGYELRTIAYGTCMSAALHIFSAGTTRKCQRNTRFLIHNVQTFSFGGRESSESFRRISKDLDEISKRSFEILKSQSKMSDKFLKDISENDRDYFFWSDEALELGLVDSIL